MKRNCSERPDSLLPQTSPEQLFPAESWRQGFVVRGCAQEFSDFFMRAYGGQSLLTGREALLELCSERHFERPKIRHLVRQGLRWLYRDNWQQAEQLFVFRGCDNRILALLTLSGRGPRRWHTELLLRAPEAPAGVVEALLVQVYACLSAGRDSRSGFQLIYIVSRTSSFFSALTEIRQMRAPRAASLSSKAS